MRAPCIACWRAMTEAANEIATEAMVTVCPKRRPSFQPRNPARIAPASGANAARHERVIRSMFFSALEGPQVGDVDGAQVAEKRHEDRQPDRGFRGRHREG